MTLSAELQAALVRAIVSAYDGENRVRFGMRLVRPVFVLSEAASRLGRWVHASRTLELGRAFITERPWLEVVSVLQHEMAHQYVDEVLGVRPSDEPAHGPAFQRVCAERGIDARATGAATPAVGAPPEPILDRIRKLLALAASSNQHEAELAMNKAHELMLRHNIAAAAAQAERGFVVRHLGDPGKRGTRVEREIAGLLVEFFFVRAIRVPVYVAAVGREGLAYEIVGTPANVEMAAHVYEFLLATAERLWRDNRPSRAGEARDTRLRSGRDRIAYQSGVISGFREKLREERTGLARGQGLVWVGDAKLEQFYRQRHPHITTRRTAVALTVAHLAGREAGRSVVLHKPITASTSAGRRLPGG